MLAGPISAALRVPSERPFRPASADRGLTRTNVGFLPSKQGDVEPQW
jgi:hypothetical protein